MDRKSTLRDLALEYFLAQGVADLSLRPLAERIGSSARLLIYHFGTKEELIATVMHEARHRVQQSLSACMAQAGQDAGLQTVWQWITHVQNSRYVRLFFEVQMLALQNPTAYARYVEDNSNSWLTLIEAALPPSPQRRAIALLCGAVIDGLTLEYLNNGNLHDTTAALEIFQALLQERGKANRKT